MSTWEGDIVTTRRGRVPLMVAAALPVATLVLAWAGHHQLSATPVFVPVWLVLAFAFDLMTVVLLLEQYRTGGDPRLLALTWAYTWSAVMIVAIVATLRGAGASGGLVAASPEVSVWLMSARLVGGPALVVVALLPWSERFDAWLRNAHGRTRRAVGTQLVVASTASMFVVLVVGDLVSLPSIAQSVSGAVVLDEGVNRALVVVTLLFLSLGLFGFRARRQVQGLEAWAIVALVATCGGTILTLVSAAPYDVAWYGARALGLFATFMVLNGLLRGAGHLQAQVRAYALRLEAQNAQLTEAQGLRDHLVAVVSHDMRTPLTGLTGYLDLVLEADEPLGPAEIHRMHTRSRLLARRLTLMTEDLLASAALTDLTVFPKPVGLREQLGECVAGFPDLDVILRCPVDLQVDADELRLQQVLANLVRNAQKYGAEPVRIHATRYGSTARIAVTDAGAGVPTEFVPRLFERYTRADASLGRGSGLGLSISRRLVERHGGTLDYEPATNEFVVLLPAVSRQRARAALSFARPLSPSVTSEPA